MGKIFGQKEYHKFLKGGRLTRKEAILAHCYECNGLESSRCDCLGVPCPMYQYHPYRNNPCRHEKRAAQGLNFNDLP